MKYHTFRVEVSDELQKHEPVEALLTIHNNATLPEILESFERFIGVMGFSVPKDSHLDFIEND